jgi:hypothetical protein
MRCSRAQEGARFIGAGFGILLATALLGCSSSPRTNPRDAADANDTGRKLVPSSESERALLREVMTLPNGAPKRIGHDTVVADAAYQAASGRTCRALRVTSGPEQRAAQHLACTDGRAWFFVPDVFGSNQSAE